MLSVSTRFIRVWITSRYLDQILQIVKLHKKNIKTDSWKLDLPDILNIELIKEESFQDKNKLKAHDWNFYADKARADRLAIIKKYTIFTNA